MAAHVGSVSPGVAGNESAPRRSETPIKLAIEVASLAAVRALAAHLGGQVDPSDREWEFRRATHCDAGVKSSLQIEPNI